MESSTDAGFSAAGADFVDFLSQPLSWLLLAIYFMPTIMALFNRSSGWPVCFWVNLFFGWTFVGWLICMVLCCLPTKEHYEYSDKVKRARDEFYLRDQEKVSKAN